MTPHKFRLKGSLGILCGLGRDELSVDLDALVPPDARRIAIRGDNGSGKTTLLNLAMSPELNPPQLTGTVYEEFGEHGERIIEWTHGGERYRSTITYRRTAKTKSTKATLLRQNGDRWEPVQLPDHTVSDGSAASYEACIRHILGPKSVYYLSAFRAQNAPKIGDYDDPKGLMRDLLGLDEPERLSELAKDVTRELKRTHESIRQEVRSLDATKQEADDLSLKIADLEAKTEELSDRKTQAARVHAMAKAEYDEAVKANLDLERVRAARTDVELQIARRQEALERELKQLRVAWSEAVQAHAKLQSANQRERLQVANRRVDLELRAKEMTTLLAEEKEIREAAATLVIAEGQLVWSDEKIADLRKKVEEKRRAALELTELSHLVRQAHTTWEAATKGFEADRQRAGYVDVVPCHGEGPYASCPALGDAKLAASGLAIMQQEVARSEAEYNEHFADQAARQQAFDALGAPEVELQGAENSAAALRSSIRALTPLANKIETLDIARSTIEDCEKQLVKLQSSLEALDASMTEAQQERDTAQHDAKTRADDAKTRADADLADLKKQLHALPKPDDNDGVEHARKRLAECDRGMLIAGYELEMNTASIATNRSVHEGLQKDLDRGAATMKRALRLEEEIGDWTLLGIALKGVVNLSIEDAGPGIASIANQLLRDSFGPRYTLKILTQREQANGKLVECFLITVLDAENGIEAPVSKKSGGQNVWFDKALSEAVGLYHQDAAGMQYETLFADEAEDGLTPQRRLQYYQMDLAAMDLGGYDGKYFVSQHEAAWEGADAVIDMEGFRA